MIRLEYRRADVSLVVELEDIPGGEVHLDPYVVAWSSALDRLTAAEIAHVTADKDPGGAYCVECKLPLVGHVVDVDGHLMHRHCFHPECAPAAEDEPAPPPGYHHECEACGDAIHGALFVADYAADRRQARYHAHCVPVGTVTRRGGAL